MTQSAGQPGKFGAANAALAALSLLAIVLAVATVLASGEERELAGKKIPAAKADIAEMIKEKEKIVAMRNALPEGVILEIPERPEGLISLIEKKADENRIGKQFRKQISHTEERRREWKEHAYTIALAGTKTEKIRREDIVAFLLGVEIERPYLRTKTLSLTFADNDLEKADATISYFKREAPKPPAGQ
ncbi:MAG: hypothetical protein A2Z34_00390 [Planctomycetes bacterium RBG_16_59_8]|nr:MAG: hypothetical protein A2Z34_00390 [Planctomycetes bacterium RBG_16_59_8]